MTLDEKAWMQANKETKIAWTEEEILRVYLDNGSNPDVQAWCKVLLAGVLGNESRVKEKYPEMYI